MQMRRLHYRRQLPHVKSVNTKNGTQCARKNNFRFLLFVFWIFVFFIDALLISICKRKKPEKTIDLEMLDTACSIYLAWPALRICVRMLASSSRFRFPRMCVPKRALQNFSARLSLEIFNNSMHRFSYGACPTTSRTKSRTNFVCLVWIWKWNAKKREFTQN